MSSKFRRIFTTALLLCLLVTMTGCIWPWQNQPQTQIEPLAPPKQPRHLLLGNPSKATADAITNGNNYLIKRPQYDLSYNNVKRIPNWVSWQLNPAWIGDTPRSDTFRPDDSLPANWYKVTPSDYTRSGYDRGHMIPSADRDNNPENQASTFLMTNIVPQSPDNNRGPWAQLEEYCRALVTQGKELYIVAGTYGKQGEIGQGGQKITVPQTVWKVIVVMNRVGQYPSDVGPQTRVIAVDMPNVPGIKDHSWQQYRVTVDHIEQKTGYDLLNRVKPDVQASIESRIGS
ncbi:MAG: DNA/RNA non-specific endonuclease [Alkalinema sp. RL_2_19]|nr:DNA/RNA non-specific endonuclease [Alkalinema sp. RL_2_19]